jgi:hypothetical protein
LFSYIPVPLNGFSIVAVSGSFQQPQDNNQNNPPLKQKKAKLPELILRQLGHASTCSAFAAFRPLLAKGLVLSGNNYMFIILEFKSALVEHKTINVVNPLKAC